MRAERLINILTTLQARGRATATELAEENHVSLRTIYRDIDNLANDTEYPEFLQAALEVTLPVGSMPNVVSDLLRLGSDLEVLSPISLREAMRETVQTLAAYYSTY